jgi:hypothetical protein
MSCKTFPRIMCSRTAKQTQAARPKSQAEVVVASQLELARNASPDGKPPTMNILRMKFVHCVR